MSNINAVALACFALAFASACTQTAETNKPQTASPAVMALAPSAGGGDWAVGTWSGFRVDKGERRALQSVQGVLTVERGASGTFVCTGKSQGGATFPITTCVVDDTGMTLASASAGGFQTKLARTAPNTISGVVEIVGTSFRYDLTLTKM